jgi:hypothetical protein
MSDPNKTLFGKLQRSQKIALVLCNELGELIESFKDPDILKAELEGLAPEINDKFDRVLDYLILKIEKRHRPK